jgi:hypothetical protein
MGNAHSATATAILPSAGGKSVDSESSDDDVQDLGQFNPLSNRERELMPVALRDEAPLDSDDDNVFVSPIEQVAVAIAPRGRAILTLGMLCFLLRGGLDLQRTWARSRVKAQMRHRCAVLNSAQVLSAQHLSARRCGPRTSVQSALLAHPTASLVSLSPLVPTSGLGSE